MYAIVEEGGTQYKVCKEYRLNINRRHETPDSEIILDKVLFYSSDNGDSITGTPYIKQARVIAKSIENIRGKKVIIFKKKRRKGYARKNGHRQELTRIEILDIVIE